MATDARSDPPDVRDWLDGLATPARGDVAEVFALVQGADPRLERAIKWGRLTFTVAGDWHHWLCGIAVTKKGVKLVFHKGALLPDPRRILLGSGRYVREVPAAAALREREAIIEIVRKAIAQQTDMLDH